MKRVCMALIRLYRRYLSPLKPHPTCRFTPTCSAYALEAFEKRGFFAGLALMLWRILRCSPLSPAGYDPVPRAGFHTMPLRWSRFDRYKREHPECFSDTAAPVAPESDTPAPEDHPSDDA